MVTAVAAEAAMAEVAVTSKTGVNMYKNKRFHLYLLKNTIAFIVPALLVFTVLMGLISHFNIMDRFTFKQLINTEIPESSAINKSDNVKIHIDHAEYMGYDYYLDNKKAGRYYYTFIDGKCIVMLINSKEDVISDYDIKGVIKEDTTLYRYLLNQCANDMDMNIEQLEQITYDYVISEVDYPENFYNMVQLFIALLIVMMLFHILQGIYWLIFPWKTPSVKSINGVANGKLVIHDLNKQLRDKILLEQKDIIVTEKYIIAPSLLHTDVILIDHIEVLSKHMERKKHLLFRNRDVYKLIISDSEDMFYEQEFENEKLIDEVIPLLEQKREMLKQGV